jgi:hypothetical protein
MHGGKGRTTMVDDVDDNHHQSAALPVIRMWLYATMFGVAGYAVAAVLQPSLDGSRWVVARLLIVATLGVLAGRLYPLAALAPGAWPRPWPRGGAVGTGQLRRTR